MTKRRKKGSTQPVAPDPAHAPGKRGLGPPPAAQQGRRSAEMSRSHDQPWVPTGGLVGRSRRAGRGA